MLTRYKNEEVELSTVNGRHFLHVPVGRGEEFRIHLESHGIRSILVRGAEPGAERLGVEEGTDPEVVRAIVDQWEQ